MVPTLPHPSVVPITIPSTSPIAQPVRQCPVALNASLFKEVLFIAPLYFPSSSNGVASLLDGAPELIGGHPALVVAHLDCALLTVCVRVLHPRDPACSQRQDHI